MSKAEKNMYMEDDDIELDDLSEYDVINVMKDVKEVNDLYYISLLILDKLSNSKGKYKVLSELAYLVDMDSLLNLIYYFGGQTVWIPSIEDMQSTLQLISIYRNYDILGKSWHESLRAAGVPTDTATSRSYKSRMIAFRRHLESVRLPKELKIKEIDDNENR